MLQAFVLIGGFLQSEAGFPVSFVLFESRGLGLFEPFLESAQVEISFTLANEVSTEGLYE